MRVACQDTIGACSAFAGVPGTINSCVQISLELLQQENQEEKLAPLVLSGLRLLLIRKYSSPYTALALGARLPTVSPAFVRVDLKKVDIDQRKKKNISTRKPKPPPPVELPGS